MSSTPHHTHSHSMPQMQAVSSSPPHLREYAASHRPGSSMSISSMLGTDADSARPRPSLPPPIPASQTSPIANGHTNVDKFRNWNENRNNRAYTGLPPRPFSSATYADPPRFGPALPNLSAQSPPRNTITAEVHSPTNVSYDYRRTSAPPYEIPRAGVQEEGGRLASSMQNHNVVHEPRYTPSTRPPRILEQQEPSALSPVKQFPESDMSTPSYPFLSKTIPTTTITSTTSPLTSAALSGSVAQPAATRMIAQRSLDSRSERQSSSPELSRNHRETGLRSLQEIRRDSAGTPDPLSTPRGSPLLRRSFAALASGGEDGLDKKMMDMFDDKRGRASPLPQAVQGAQAQSKGPTNEPGIKNEFARMFSGIGSGVGSAVSTPVPQEAQLPGSLRDSPPDRDGRGTPLGGKGGVVDSKYRDSPRMATKRQRRDDTVKHEEDAGISLARTLSGRGQKRTRNNYQNVGTPLAQPHHHHHVHHHHHLIDGAIPRRATPVQTASTATPHHHHHHHYHHHHHGVKSAGASHMRRPQILVNSRPVLDPVKYKARYHLGSMLYQSKISAPVNEFGEEEAKLGFVATPTAIPKFEDKENCTFTVRIARTFLQKTARLEICERRYLWGTEVYSDDSDPIAVAIHSGWLQGAWDDTVDPSLYESDGLGPATAQTMELAKSKETTIIIPEKPATPMIPVPGRDLHVTLVLLPRLQSYGSTVSRGVKSREWKGKHDGVSYKIERIAWIDEGLSKGEERGGEARRKRMNAVLGVDTNRRAPSSISTSFASKVETKAPAPAEVSTTATLTP